ncbi:MAG: NAD(P)/FAD-dependent oxidoreductase [candidate division Zixibacteria bacterium]|nr:NAD(P)/FAD-dependent oxidoreductase [candidate division Zixibacteria bacterium]
MAGKKVIVIGGGPAGLIAAGQAAALGAETLLLEAKPRAGLKLAITGKGRCNITNTASLPDFVAHFGKNGRFLHQAFHRFFVPDLIAFLGEIGIGTVTERGGRVFPVEEDAQVVVEALVRWTKDQGVTISNRSSVEKLLIEQGTLRGVRVGERDIMADAVIVATGGVSYPATGSTGDGYRFAAAAGHQIIPVRPALIPLETSGDVALRLQGLSLKNVAIRVRIDGKKRHEAFGEMLFTHFGLSGPTILSLSRHVVDALRQEKKVSISIDLKPALEERKLEARLLRDLQAHGKRQFDTLLKGLLPAKLIPVCCDLNGIEPEKAGHHITADERKRLRLWLKDFCFEVTGHRPPEEAIVTAGGVDTRQVDPRTMESRLVPGLFLAGEVLNVDGDTGGFNLQAAFSTGFVAGQSAAQGCQ